MWGDFYRTALQEVCYNKACNILRIILCFTLILYTFFLVMLMPREKIGRGTIGIPLKEPLALDLFCDDAIICYRNYFSSCSNINSSMLTVLFYFIIKKHVYEMWSFYLLISIKNTVLQLVYYYLNLLLFKFYLQKKGLLFLMVTNCILKKSSEQNRFCA